MNTTQHHIYGAPKCPCARCNGSNPAYTPAAKARWELTKALNQALHAAGAYALTYDQLVCLASQDQAQEARGMVADLIDRVLTRMSGPEAAAMYRLLDAAIPPDGSNEFDEVDHSNDTPRQTMERLTREELMGLLWAIREAMDGKEWCSDTCQEIADNLNDWGLAPREPDAYGGWDTDGAEQAPLSLPEAQAASNETMSAHLAALGMGAVPTIPEPTDHDTLTDEFRAWCERAGFQDEDGDADDLLHNPRTTDAQKAWLRDFSARWDARLAFEESRS